MDGQIVGCLCVNVTSLGRQDRVSASTVGATDVEELVLETRDLKSPLQAPAGVSGTDRWGPLTPLVSPSGRWSA